MLVVTMDIQPCCSVVRRYSMQNQILMEQFISFSSLAKKVARKRLIRGAVYERRAALILRLLGRYAGLDIEGLRPVANWGPILPIDRSRQVADERSLVEAGIQSRRTAAAHLGSEDPEAEWARVREEGSP